METRLTIGKLGRAAGLNPKTIRYYEEIDLLPPPVRAGNGYCICTPYFARQNDGPGNNSCC